jgi:hypothetical protein
MSLPHLFRFRDLQERGIVNNRVTLKNWIDKGVFPPGRLVGPNTRLWDEVEIAAWLASRPVERKPAPIRRRDAAARQGVRVPESEVV